jgi:DNA transformation protein
MPDRLDDLKNLGPATVRMLAEIDVKTAAELRQLGAVETWRRLKFRFGSHVTLNALYALEAALQGRHWLDLSPVEKAALKASAGQGGGQAPALKA